MAARQAGLPLPARSVSRAARVSREFGFALPGCAVDEALANGGMHALPEWVLDWVPGVVLETTCLRKTTMDDMSHPWLAVRGTGPAEDMLYAKVSLGYDF